MTSIRGNWLGTWYNHKVGIASRNLSTRLLPPLQICPIRNVYVRRLKSESILGLPKNGPEKRKS